MTPEEIMALPADKLPKALYAAGLAPGNARANPPPGKLVYIPDWLGEDVWRPHERWQDCMPLFFRFGMRLHHLWLAPPHAPCWVVAVEAGAFNTSHRCATPENVPDAICRLALWAAARTQEAPGA